MRPNPPDDRHPTHQPRPRSAMNVTPAHPAPSVRPALRWLAWTGAVLACLAVFGLYTVPDFMVMVADQVWSCF